MTKTLLTWEDGVSTHVGRRGGLVMYVVRHVQDGCELESYLQGAQEGQLSFANEALAKEHAEADFCDWLARAQLLAE